MPIARLERTVFKLSGKTVIPWLEGLITNTLSSDINFAALLTPQGKIIADFFVTRHDEGLLLDTPRKFSADLLKRLKLYKLREKIEITDISGAYNVYALWDGHGEVGQIDPRSTALGRRLISDDLLAGHDGEAPDDANDDYDTHRLALGIPDSATDFDTTSLYPANSNMDLLNGVNFQKGCFVGQEVVSRMHRKTQVRKRLCGFAFNGGAQKGGAQRGDTILADEKSIGIVAHVNGVYGMALIRLDKQEAARSAPMLNGHAITITPPVTQANNG